MRALLSALDARDRAGRAAIAVGINLVRLAGAVARLAQIRNVEGRRAEVGRITVRAGHTGHAHRGGQVLDLGGPRSRLRDGITGLPGSLLGALPLAGIGAERASARPR